MSDGDPMKNHEQKNETAIWIPLTPEDVSRLECLLTETNPFVTSAIDTAYPYRLTDYLNHSINSGIPVYALFDRNLMSRVVQLARGQHVDHSATSSSTDRVASACMAFLITAKVQIEPNISLYELVESQKNSNAKEELTGFWIADHIHPQAYLEVALCRAPGIHPDLIDKAKSTVESRLEAPAEINFAMPLRHWRRHRCILTKIVHLERSDLSGEEKLHKLIAWSVNPGYFDAIALSFAILLFGRNTLGKMLKFARSNNLERCFSGIRNAAWDLTYISHWASEACKSEDERIWIFCTNDRVCAELAKASVGNENDIESLFKNNWNRSEAVRLHDHYRKSYNTAQSSANRAAELKERFENIDELRGIIERQIESDIAEASIG